MEDIIERTKYFFNRHKRAKFTDEELEFINSQPDLPSELPAGTILYHGSDGIVKELDHPFIFVSTDEIAGRFFSFKGDDLPHIVNRYEVIEQLTLAEYVDFAIPDYQLQHHYPKTLIKNLEKSDKDGAVSLIYMSEDMQESMATKAMQEILLKSINKIKFLDYIVITADIPLDWWNELNLFRNEITREEITHLITDGDPAQCTRCSNISDKIRATNTKINNFLHGSWIDILVDKTILWKGEQYVGLKG